MFNDKSGIYKWTNKVNNKIYIGQAKDLDKRKTQFQYFKKRYGGVYINNARDKYNSSVFWDYEVIEYCTEDELNEREKYYIKLFNSTDREIGYNITEGGDGCIGYVFTEEAKKAVSEGLKRSYNNLSEKEKKIRSDRQKGENNHFYGKHHTEETKQKISNKLKGIFEGEKNPFYGKHHTQELKDIISDRCSKAIYQIDPDTNEIIKEWKSASEASKELNCCRKGINNCCLGKLKISSGYKWCYKDHPELMNNEPQLNKRPILAFLIDSGEFFKEYKSIRDASKELNITESRIKKYLYGIRKSVGKYMFRYKV